MPVTLDSKFKSVKDALPVNDGKFYDVICIVKNYSIQQSYGYYIGKYCDGMFHISAGIYPIIHDFKCNWRQEKVIAWKPLEKPTREEMQILLEKGGN